MKSLIFFVEQFFQLSIKSDLGLLSFCLLRSVIGLKKFAALSQPIKCDTKTNLRFPALQSGCPCQNLCCDW